ncbi:unnamed protein product [Prunus armeniaca]
MSTLTCDKYLTFEDTLCRIPASKSAPKSYKNKKIYEKKSKTTASGRPREYHIKGFGFALQSLLHCHFVVHEGNGHIPRILQWRSNTLARFHELMSQVFENCEVDMQLLRPSVIDKKQPYWTWGDNVENIEEIVELFANEDEEKTSTSVDQKDDEVHKTATLPSSSKGKLSSTELRTLKHESNHKG